MGLRENLNWVRTRRLLIDLGSNRVFVDFQCAPLQKKNDLEISP